MQAIATEIIIATQNAKIQNLNPQPKSQNDSSFSGKSFAEYLASYSETDSKPVEKTSYDSDSVAVKKLAENEKPVEQKVEATGKNVEENTADKRIEKTEEPQNSTKKSAKKDVKEEKSEVGSGKKNPRKVGKDEASKEKISYLRLDLIKQDNFASEAENVSEFAVEKDSEVEVLPENPTGKIASALGKDEKGLKILEKTQGTLSDEEHGFAVEDFPVEIKTLALESVQEMSPENTELVLNETESWFDNETEIRFDNETLEGVFVQAEAGTQSVYDLDLDSTEVEKPKPRLTVTDLRTQKTDKEINVAKFDNAEPKLKVQTVIDSSDSATITMDLNQSSQNVADNVLSLNSQAAASDGSNFQAMLNNQIQSNAAEFVKASNIILKDNDKGTINLVLHPDDLGDVKFHLSLDGNKIAGHITVNTREALEVFRDNAQTLREAFIKSGFENAGFEVSYNSNGSGGNGEFQEHRQNQNSFFAKRQYGAFGGGDENQVAAFENNNFDDFNINIVA